MHKAWDIGERSNLKSFCRVAELFFLKALNRALTPLSRCTPNQDSRANAWPLPDPRQAISLTHGTRAGQVTLRHSRAALLLACTMFWKNCAKALVETS